MEMHWTPELIKEFKEILPPFLVKSCMKVTQLIKEKFDSSIEILFVKILNKYQIDYIKYPQFKIDFNGFYEGKRQKYTYTPDFYLPKNKLVVEIYTKNKTKNIKSKCRIITLLFPDAMLYLDPHHIMISKRELLGLFGKHQLSSKYRKHLQLIYKKLGLKP